MDVDGTISDIKALGASEAFNKEAIRAISKIKDIWKPAKVNDMKVRCRYILPLTMEFN